MIQSQNVKYYILIPVKGILGAFFSPSTASPSAISLRRANELTVVLEHVVVRHPFSSRISRHNFTSCGGTVTL